MTGKRNNEKGFTLIEIIVVLAVIGTLLAALTPMILSYITDSKNRAAANDVKAIGSAIIALNKDTAQWPVRVSATGTSDDITILEGTGDVVPDSGGTNIAASDQIADHIQLNTAAYDETGRWKWRGPYMESVKNDPWGNMYYVDVTGLRKANLHDNDSTAFVISAGPDEVMDTTVGAGTAKAAKADSDDIYYRIK